MRDDIGTDLEGLQLGSCRDYLAAYREYAKEAKSILCPNNPIYLGKSYGGTCGAGAECTIITCSLWDYLVCEAGKMQREIKGFRLDVREDY